MYPKGISIHGMKLLSSHRGHVSLDDLKQYDRTGQLKEITQLKRKARQLPVQGNANKILRAEDFITFHPYGKPWDNWRGHPVDVVTIWKNMIASTPLRSTRHEELFVQFFYVPTEVIREYKPITIDDESLTYFLVAQSVQEVITPIHVPFFEDGLVFGHVEYWIKDADTIFIDELQSKWESGGPHQRDRKQRTLTSSVLTEFVRTKATTGFTKFRMWSHESRQEFWKGTHCPTDIYSRLPRSLGFEKQDGIFILDL